MEGYVSYAFYVPETHKHNSEEKDYLTLSLILGLRQHSLLGCHEDLSILQHGNEASQF